MEKQILGLDFPGKKSYRENFMKKIYTISFLKKSVVNVSKETPNNLFSNITEKTNQPEATQFIANYDKSQIFFAIPQRVILTLGRFFKKRQQLELGYLLHENIWYILEKNTLLWSDKVITLKENEKISKYNRYTALKKNYKKTP
jgi:hypothetical protein